MSDETLHELLSTLTTRALELLGVEDAHVSVQTGYRTVVAVSAPTESPLCQSDEYLQALNTVLHRMVEKQSGETHVSFLVDINGHHEEKVENVRAGARVLAQRARLFKHNVEMEPMPPYERLVVHELFAEDPDIKTESAGEGKFRRIILKYGKS